MNTTYVIDVENTDVFTNIYYSLLKPSAEDRGRNMYFHKIMMRYLFISNYDGSRGRAGIDLFLFLDC